MSDENNTDRPAAKKPAPTDKESGQWSTSAKVGAAIGSAAVAAALIYAGRHQMKKHDDFKPVTDKPLPKYEYEPDYDDGDDDDARDHSEDE